jgi:radical SAM-linked protein
MLSKGEKLTERKRLRELPALERPRTVRLKFRKVGTLQYISHLDLQRTFNRVIVRACIPVWYTKGFNPHAKLVFSTPLSVGAQSEYEFLDIRIDREMDCQEIMDRLNQELTEELMILDAYVPVEDFSEIAWASYEIEIFDRGISKETKEQVENTFGKAPLMMTKRTKAGEKEIDILPLIRSMSVNVDDTAHLLRLSVILRATSTEYLNPEMLITAIKEKIGLLSGAPLEEWYTILRTSVMKEDLSQFH